MVNQDSMAFLQLLSRELLQKEISLPSFPDAVIQIRDALESEDCDIKRIAELASIESVLASRLVAAANSAYYNAGGRPIADLQAAVMRLGLKEVRNMAITLAVEQLFLSQQHADIRKEIGTLWHRSVFMSSVAHVLAQRCATGIAPDQAFLCGLLHEIGKLYILTKARQFPGVAFDLNARSDAPDAWHPQVGLCIVEDWGFDGVIAATLQPSEKIRPIRGARPALVDVVFAAEMICSDSDGTPIDFEHVSMAKLGLDRDRLDDIEPDIQERMDSMLQMLAR